MLSVLQIESPEQIRAIEGALMLDRSRALKQQVDLFSRFPPGSDEREVLGAIYQEQINISNAILTLINSIKPSIGQSKIERLLK